MLHLPNTDPRERTLDWQALLELQILRREAETTLKTEWPEDKADIGKMPCSSLWPGLS